MSKYEEMCQSVIEAQNRDAEYRDRCWRQLATLYNGFLQYTQTPANRVTLLKWNGHDDETSRFSPPESGIGAYTIQGAAVLGSDGFWRLGIRIFLEPMATVWFAFFVAEQDGHPVTKVGDKTYRVDLDNSATRGQLYDDIVERIKDAFKGKKQNSKAIGFVVETALAS